MKGNCIRDIPRRFRIIESPHNYKLNCHLEQILSDLGFPSTQILFGWVCLLEASTVGMELATTEIDILIASPTAGAFLTAYYVGKSASALYYTSDIMLKWDAAQI